LHIYVLCFLLKHKPINALYRHLNFDPHFPGLLTGPSPIWIFWRWAVVCGFNEGITVTVCAILLWTFMLFRDFLKKCYFGKVQLRNYIYKMFFVLCSCFMVEVLTSSSLRKRFLYSFSDYIFNYKNDTFFIYFFIYCYQSFI